MTTDDDGALQPPPRRRFELATFFPRQMFEAHEAISALIDACYLQCFQLTGIQWRIIAILERAPRAQRQLCDVLGTDKVSVNRAVQTLDGRGVLERIYDERDRRTHLLVLTPEGAALSLRIEAKAFQISDALLAGSTSEEEALLRATMDRLRGLATCMRESGELLREVDETTAADR